MWNNNSNKNLENSVKLDVGNYIGKKICEETKKNLILNPWVPPKCYKFPFSTHTINGKEIKRYSSHKYLESYEWLVFSDIQQGYFCKYCPFFVNYKLGGYQKNVPLNYLVSQPLKNFKKLLGANGYLNTHNTNQYHLDAIRAAKDFLEVFNNPKLSIDNRLDNLRSKELEKLKELLGSMVKTILLVGRQNIPLRGHRDDGKLNSIMSDENHDGNFKAILEYCAECDESFKSLLESTSSRSSHTSKTTQTELIECCKEEILSQMITEVQAAQFYSIMFDETTDISSTAQLTLVLRYVTGTFKNYTIREEFIEFIDVRKEMSLSNDPEEIAKDDEISEEQVKLTGQKIGQIVSKMISDLNLNLKNCVGISTDGCATMTSEVSGAVVTIQEKAKNAVKCPCYNHALNLAIPKSSKVRAIRNAVDVMQDTTIFLNASSKRSAILKQKFSKKLIELCETRWVERHDAVFQFRNSLPTIIAVLSSVAKWKDKDSSGKAQGLIKALTKTDTLVAIVSLSDLLTCTKGLSKFLQNINIDVKSARNELNLTVKMLKNRREKSEEFFNNIFYEINGIAEELNIELKKPRIVSRQVHRENHSNADNSVDIESYYRQSVYNPTLDNIIRDIEDRFSDDILELYNFSVLFPNSQYDNNFEEVTQLVHKYAYFLDNSPEYVAKELKIELEKWNLKWSINDKNDSFSYTAIYLLNECDPIIYPRINFFLRIASALSISNATPERTFSALRRLKTWLRSTMTQDRLTGLALLHIHRKRNIDPSVIVDRYCNKKKRRFEFAV